LKVVEARVRKITPVWRRARAALIDDREILLRRMTGRRAYGCAKGSSLGQHWITGSMHRRSARSFLQFQFMDRLLPQPGIYNLRFLYRMGAIHAAVQGEFAAGRGAMETAPSH
jgi:hypothetical protein